MSRRTFNDIDAELLLRLANRTDITSGMRANFIKDSYLNIAMMFRHKEIEKITTAETIALGADTCTPIATDLWFPRMLRNTTDGYIIRNDSLERIERAQTKPTSRPYTYYWFNGVFHFEALADTLKTLKLWYKRKPVDFSGTTSSELDELFDPFIIMDAARIGFETVRDYDEAKEQLQLFNAEVARKKVPVDEAKLNDYRQGFKVRVR